MIKYTHKENREMVATMTVKALALGLLKPNQSLVYEQGNTRQGHATYISVVENDDLGNRHRNRRPEWVPEFGYKDGPSIIGTALVAAGNVLDYLYRTQVVVKL